METIAFFIACIGIIANIALVFAIIILTETIKRRINVLQNYIDRQSELIIIMSKLLRKNDEHQNIGNILFQKIQSSIRDFNNRMSLNVIDDDKPLEFPNDEK